MQGMPPGAGGGMQQPVLVMNQNTKRETGHEAQLANIQAARAVSDTIRTCLGPKAMLKMLLNPMGGIVMTNDGYSILREIDVSQPAAKQMIELAKTQDEEVGDGTTSVIVLAGETLAAAEPWLKQGMHPTEIIRGYTRALADLLRHLDTLAVAVDPKDDVRMLEIIGTCLNTKFVKHWQNLMCTLSLRAIRTIVRPGVDGAASDVDIARYIKIEKIPGGDIDECEVVAGCILNKDVTHASMRRRIENPRIILLDCPLEYTKLESQTMIELTKAEDFERVLKLEEDAVKQMVDEILAHKPDLVITEKGLSDLAQHYFVKAGVTALRRLRKSDNNRIAAATGATIVHRTDELVDSDVGTKCGLYEVRKIGDEYFSYITDCREPKACTLVLRGANKDVLNEVERNLHDALAVTRNMVLDHRLLPGGGATEMSCSQFIVEQSKKIEGTQQHPYRSIAVALECIPRTLAQNSGENVVRALTALRAKHAADPKAHASFGIDGNSGAITDMAKAGVFEPFAVKSQVLKSAIESSCLLLRVDDIVSGVSKPQQQGGPSPMAQGGGMPGMEED